jgi:hypothetical protein
MTGLIFVLALLLQSIRDMGGTTDAFASMSYPRGAVNPRGWSPCQPMTVSGLTMIRADRQRDHKRESQTLRHRSARPRTSRFVFSLQHDQLMTERDDLGLYYSLALKAV